LYFQLKSFLPNLFLPSAKVLVKNSASVLNLSLYF
jgi:hypothetical protein